MKTKRNHTKRDIAQEITDNIIQAIESGANGKDWIMPWHGAKSAPVNAQTKSLYHGVNIINLWLSNFPSNTFATFKQWKDMDCHVKKDEKGSPVVFYKLNEKEVTNSNGDRETEKWMILRYSTVFAAEQVEGYEIPKTEYPDLVETQQYAESFFSATGINVKHGEARAYYVPSQDFVNMPPKETFFNTDSTATENYYSTLAHECTHATGHKLRLDRRDVIRKKFEKDPRRAYAFEELVAELGASYTMAHLGLESTPRIDHAQYIEYWLSILKADKRAILKAASLASKALDWMQTQQQVQEAA